MFGWYDENVEKWIFFFFFFCWEEKWKGKKNNSYKFTSIPFFDKKINNKLKKKKSLKFEHVWREERVHE